MNEPTTVPEMPASGYSAIGSPSEFGFSAERSPYSSAAHGATNASVVGFITSIVIAVAITRMSSTCARDRRVAEDLDLDATAEFGIKVAILSSLVATCALVPLFERLAQRIDARRSGAEIAPRAARQPLVPRLAGVVRNPVLVAVAVLAIAAPVNTALLPRDESILLIEQGLTPRNVQ